MLQVPEESSCSTGEPPTSSTLHNQPEVMSASATPVPANSNSDCVPENATTTASSSKLSPTPQEPDSGYEASPSSINDSCTFSFERHQHTDSISSAADEESLTPIADRSLVGPLEEDELQFGDLLTISMPFAADGDSVQNSQHLVRATGRTLQCFSPQRLIPRQTNFATSFSRSDDRRPTCLPVPIPVVRRYHSQRHRGPRSISVFHSQSLPSAMTRNVPEPPPPVSSLLRVTVPFAYSTSLPNNPCYFLSYSSSPSIDVEFLTCNDDYQSPRRNERSTRDRGYRRPPGSEHSSESSSQSESGGESYDEEEDVFHELYPPGYAASSAPMSNGHIWFVRNEESATRACNQRSSPHNNVDIRRGRSASVNLPLDRHQIEAIRNVGRTLRRLSDLFGAYMDLRQAAMQRRRYTIGGEIVINISEDHPRSDSDDDPMDLSRIRRTNGKDGGLS